MKALLVFSMILISKFSSNNSIYALHQKRIQNLTNINTRKLYDTIFIKREKTAEYYHKIYIEKNRSSSYYKLLTRFKFDKDELEFINEYYRSFKKRSVPLKKFNLHNIATEWLPLYKYKGHYYLYAPSDWGNTNKKQSKTHYYFIGILMVLILIY